MLSLLKTRDKRMSQRKNVPYVNERAKNKYEHKHINYA